MFYLSFIIYFIHLRILCICMHSWLALTVCISLSIQFFFLRLPANQPASHQTRKYTFKRSLKYFLIGILFPFSFSLYHSFAWAARGAFLCTSFAQNIRVHMNAIRKHMKSFNVLCIGFNLRYYLIISFVDCFLHFAYQCMSNSCTYSYAHRAIILFFFRFLLRFDTSIQCGLP